MKTKKSTFKIKIVPIILILTLLGSMYSATSAFAEESTPTPEPSATEEVTAEVTEFPATEEVAVTELPATEEVAVDVTLAPEPEVEVIPSATEAAKMLMQSVLGDVGSETTNPAPTLIVDDGPQGPNGNLDDDCSQHPDYCVHGSGDGTQHIITSADPIYYFSLHTGNKFGNLHYFDLSDPATTEVCTEDSLYCLSVEFKDGGYIYTITQKGGQDISNTQGWYTPTVTPTATTETVTATATTGTPGTGTPGTGTPGTGTPGTETATSTVTVETPGTPVDPGTPVGGATPIVAPTTVPKTGAVDMGGFAQFAFSLLGFVASGFGLLKPKYWFF